MQKQLCTGTSVVKDYLRMPVHVLIMQMMPCLRIIVHIFFLSDPFQNFAVLALLPPLHSAHFSLCDTEHMD